MDSRNTPCSPPAVPTREQARAAPKVGLSPAEALAAHIAGIGLGAVLILALARAAVLVAQFLL